jgi:hypothetical protein
MKTSPQKLLSLSVLLLVLSAAATTVRAAGSNLPEITARTNSIATVVTVRKSVFNPDVPGARNPFYPDAVRVVRKPGGDETDISVTTFSQLSLRGIVSGRSAIINNRNFVAGDEATVRLPGGRQAKIKVIEVNEESVVITIGGQKESKTLYAKGAAR